MRIRAAEIYNFNGLLGIRRMKSAECTDKATKGLMKVVIRSDGWTTSKEWGVIELLKGYMLVSVVGRPRKRWIQ